LDETHRAHEPTKGSRARRVNQMAKIVGNKICFGFHETAWSRRTSGFPIWGIKKTEEGYKVQQIAETQKKPFTIDYKDFLCIVRYYESNSGYVTLYVYYIENNVLKEVTVKEQENFAISGVPSEIAVAVKKIAELLMSGAHYFDINEKVI